MPPPHLRACECVVGWYGGLAAASQAMHANGWEPGAAVKHDFVHEITGLDFDLGLLWIKSQELVRCGIRLPTYRAS